MYPNLDRSSEFLLQLQTWLYPQIYLVEGFANKGYFLNDYFESTDEKICSGNPYALKINVIMQHMIQKHKYQNQL